MRPNRFQPPFPFPIRNQTRPILGSRAYATADSDEDQPADIVDLKAIAPPVIVDRRCAGLYKLIGRSLPGYDANKCLLSPPSAKALVVVQQNLRGSGFSLMVYDCYRPQRSVQLFCKMGSE